MVNAYIVNDPKTNVQQSFSDAKEAGKAFCAIEGESQPYVIRVTESGGARVVADTVVFLLPGIGKEFHKTVSAMPADAAFREGYNEACGQAELVPA